MSNVNYDKMVGEFQEHDTYNWFTYKVAPNPIFGSEYPYMVWIGNNGGYRYAKIKKTRAYIVVDEDENGPVVEKWCLRRHHRWA